MSDLLERLATHARHRPDSPALVTPAGGSMTWLDLDRFTAGVALELSARGVGAGDRVLVGTITGADPVLYHLAIQRSGAQPVVLGPSDPSLVGGLVADLGIREAFADAEMASAIPATVHVWPGTAEMQAFRGAGPDRPADRGAHTIAAVHMSTGTTGVPKGIVRTVGNDYADAVNRCLTLGVRAGDRWFTAAPRNPNVAIGAFRCCLLMGATLVVLDDADPATLDRASSTTGIEVLPLQSHGWAEMIRSGVADLLADRGLRIAVVTGGRADPEVVGYLERVLGDRGSVLNVYGLTEAGNVAVSTAASRRTAGPHGVGVPAPLVDIRINGPEAGVGEVHIRGAAVTTHYLGAEQANRDGWLATGDIGALDDSGQLEILGRLADRVEIDGTMVVPYPVEHRVGSLTGVTEAVLVPGVPPTCAVTVSGAGPTTDALHAALGDLADHVRVVAVERIPRNNGGKTDRRRLRAELAEASDDSPGGGGGSE